jgi:hypothetical protein
MRIHTLLLAVSLGLVMLLAAPLPSDAQYHSASCNYCHRVKSETIGPQRAAVCLSCHGPGGSSTLRAAAHIQMDCLDCHRTHAGDENWLGGVNGKMLRNDVDKTGQHSDPQDYVSRYNILKIKAPPENYAPVVFTSRGTGAGEPSLHSFADRDEDGNGVYDGICEVCHLDVLSPNGEIPGTHHVGETCTKCHLHSNGFR